MKANSAVILTFVVSHRKPIKCYFLILSQTRPLHWHLGQVNKISIFRVFFGILFIRGIYKLNNNEDKMATPASIYLFKFNNGNTRTVYEIGSKLTIITLEQLHWRRSAVFIVNFVEVSHTVVVFQLLTLNK